MESKLIIFKFLMIINGSIRSLPSFNRIIDISRIKMRSQKILGKNYCRNQY